MSQAVNPLMQMATSSMANSASLSPSRSHNKNSSWFEAMAEAWGKTLDAKAQEIETASDQLGSGDDTPSHITQITTMAQQMAFMSNSAHTSIESVGTALETMARKQ